MLNYAIEAKRDELYIRMVRFVENVEGEFDGGMRLQGEASAILQEAAKIETLMKDNHKKWRTTT